MSNGEGKRFILANIKLAEEKKDIHKTRYMSLDDLVMSQKEIMDEARKVDKNIDDMRLIFEEMQKKS